jgi:hypothetical protein
LGLWGGVVWGIGHYILSMAQNWLKIFTLYENHF